jgi:cyclopropane-fatty-acyl-phospholipid synthase
MWNTLFQAMLSRVIRHGTLTITMPDGRQIRAGDGTQPQVAVRLTDPALPGRLARDPDLAIGEAYTDGTLVIENDDLHGFLSLLIGNVTARRRGSMVGPVAIARRALRHVYQFNPMSRARSNAAHHYDLSGALYDLFLDRDRQYSCAYFRDPTDTLEQAQAQKKAHIAAKLLLRPEMRVLDIGCGWGGLAITLARDHGVHVLGVTLSEEQHRVASDRVRAAGVQDRVEIRLTDYRRVTGTFDRVVSVGMFEHVGVPHYAEFFRTVHDRLTPDGVALIHTIGRAAPPDATNAWVARYIFPGGYVPALSEAARAFERADLWQTDIEVWRLHYAETLRRWHDRFVANIDKARALSDDRFCRMWRYYLVASEMTFRHGRQCVFQIQLARRQDAVPLTRDYIQDAGGLTDLPVLQAAE